MAKFISPQLALPKASTNIQDYTPYFMEVKLDGQRALVSVEHGEVKVFTRHGDDITSKFPELKSLSIKGVSSCLLDGEIVALKDGIPSFNLLSRRIHAGNDSLSFRYLVNEVPVIFYVFDIMELNDHPLISIQLKDRKKMLERILNTDQTIKLMPSFEFSKHARYLEMADKIKALGYEGFILKKKTARYFPGKRNEAWVKFKFNESESFVVLGWVKGNRELGALVLGRYDSGKLQFAGKVGSGIPEKDQETYLKIFDKIKAKAPSIKNYPRKEVVNWIKPVLVVEVEYLEKTGAGFRFPTFKGIRSDVSVKDLRSA